MNAHKKAGMVLVLLIIGITSFAQTKTLSLDEAIQAGIQNSKQLKLSQNKIDKALSQVEQAKDGALPSATASFGYNHALMLTRKFTLPSSDGSDPKSLELPFDNTAYIGTLSIKEPIFAGNKIKYAKQSADLLVQMSRLDAETNKDAVVYTVIRAYINYYKITQNQKIVAQNMEDIENKLTEIKKFESQGLATKNDVLRFELEKSNTKLVQIELDNNRKIANYSMNVLLGYPESTELQLQDVNYKLDVAGSFDEYLQQALKDRKEFTSLGYQQKIADINVKKVHDEKLPNLSVGGDLYYINPTKALFPKGGTFLAPFMVGVTASWDIASLYKNKNKLNEVKIEQREIAINRDALTDNIKTGVHDAYVTYQQSLEKIKVLQDAITQATENERITESKFRNNLVTTTDRIDAQTMLYLSRVNLELAKSDATAAYYNLLNVTGHIQP
ncbi:MAG: TolC family protein [Chitinophagaceae bacterium]